MIAPAYTATCTIATKGAHKPRKNTDSDAMTTTRNSALCTALRVVIIITAAAAAMSARTPKRIISSPGKAHLT